MNSKYFRDKCLNADNCDDDNDDDDDDNVACVVVL